MATEHPGIWSDMVKTAGVVEAVGRALARAVATGDLDGAERLVTERGRLLRGQPVAQEIRPTGPELPARP